MSTTSEPTAGVLVPVTDPLFTLPERQALAGYLSAYSGLTRDAYTFDEHARSTAREAEIRAVRVDSPHAGRP